ncbi:hypothetical protein FACS1894219_09610 [Clostridia bacterium]|nr:hypothetical protein FACS1894219_09610 [Clostridia bacterium]
MPEETNRNVRENLTPLPPVPSIKQIYDDFFRDAESHWASAYEKAEETVMEEIPLKAAKRKINDNIRSRLHSENPKIEPKQLTQLAKEETDSVWGNLLINEQKALIDAEFSDEPPEQRQNRIQTLAERLFTKKPFYQVLSIYLGESEAASTSIIAEHLLLLDGIDPTTTGISSLGKDITRRASTQDVGQEPSQDELLWESDREQLFKICLALQINRYYPNNAMDWFAILELDYCRVSTWKELLFAYSLERNYNLSKYTHLKERIETIPNLLLSKLTTKQMQESKDSASVLTDAIRDNFKQHMKCVILEHGMDDKACDDKLVEFVEKERHCFHDRSFKKQEILFCDILEEYIFSDYLCTDKRQNPENNQDDEWRVHISKLLQYGKFQNFIEKYNLIATSLDLPEKTVQQFVDLYNFESSIGRNTLIVSGLVEGVTIEGINHYLLRCGFTPVDDGNYRLGNNIISRLYKVDKAVCDYINTIGRRHII